MTKLSSRAMKTISIRQPHAALICMGLKRIENRTWSIAAPITLAVHASARKMTRADAAYLREVCAEFAQPVPSIAYSAIIGAMHISRVERARARLTDAEWEWSAADGLYWIIEYAGFIPDPIPIAGRLGIFDAPVEIEM